jgi:hypothetical protein
LADCCRHRQVRKIIVELKRHLDALKQGVEQLRIMQAELDPEALLAVQAAASIQEFQLAQLREPFSNIEFAALASDAAFTADATAITEQLASEFPWRGIRTIGAAVCRVSERYRDLRSALVRDQTFQAEAVQARMRALPGFDGLSAEQVHRVQKPILDAQLSTSSTAVSPTLQVLHESFRSRMSEAEARARDMLDEERCRNASSVVKVVTQFIGGEVENRDQLHALLQALEEQIGPLLDQGSRVRIG